MPSMLVVTSEPMLVSTARDDAIEWMTDQLDQLKAATTVGEIAKALDDIMTGIEFIQNMRDVLIRDLCRNGWKPTTIEKTYGICKPTVSRANRRLKKIYG